MSGYQNYLGTKVNMRMKLEIYKVLAEYCGPEKDICELGAFDDLVVGSIKFKKLWLNDKVFGECKYKEFQNIHYYTMGIEDFLELSIKSNKKFDVVFMSNVVEHLTQKERKRIFTRIEDILKDNGVFIVTYPNCRSMNRLLGAELGMIPFPEAIGVQDKIAGHMCMFDCYGLEKFVPELKMKLIRREGIMFKPLPNRMMDKYFKDDLDKFLEIGKEIGKEACGDIIGVYQKNP